MGGAEFEFIRGGNVGQPATPQRGGGTRLCVRAPMIAKDARMRAGMHSGLARICPRLCALRLISTSAAPSSLTFHLMRTQAKSLIKSLSRFSDTDVEEMCQIVQRFKASS